MITLASDFGSPYPAAMRGVLATRTDARLLDITHDFPRQDVRTAAFWLSEILPYFPPAVHLVVVDPGVGTDRAAIAIRAGDHALVGPDNGVLWPAATRLADGEPTAFEIESALPPDAPATFHGRDVFAPAAAAVHEAGVAAMETLERLRPVDDVVDLSFPTAEVEGATARGAALVVDGFGNVITNIPGEVLRTRWGTNVRVDGRSLPIERSYAAVPIGAALVTLGSHGNVELAVNRGSAADVLDRRPGDPVRLVFENG